MSFSHRFRTLPRSVKEQASSVIGNAVKGESSERSSSDLVQKTSYKREDFEALDYFDAIETDPNRSRATWVVGSRPKIDDSTLIVGPRDMAETAAFDPDAESVFQLLRASVRHS